MSQLGEDAGDRQDDMDREDTLLCCYDRNYYRFICDE
jgi:hypothetical protein